MCQEHCHVLSGLFRKQPDRFCPALLEFWSMALIENYDVKNHMMMDFDFL